MKKHKVSLSKKEEKDLSTLVKKGRHPARTINRARVLLLAHAGKSDADIRDVLGVSQWTPQNVRRKYAEGGIERALYDAPRSGQPKTVSAEEEAEITAIACTETDDGHGRWTLDILTEKANKRLKKRKKKLSRGTVYNVILRSELKPWREKNVVHNRDN